jgi:hypothetical protein
MSRAPLCICPPDDSEYRTAEDFEAMARCPLTSDDDRELFKRAALRLTQRSMRLDPRSIIFDPAFVSDEEIRRHHRARLLVCECPICHTDEPGEIDDAEEDGFAPPQVN